MGTDAPNNLGQSCEFCIEINDFKHSRFTEIYGKTQRFVFVDRNFYVMPTIGQLFTGSLLIIPKDHYCSYAEIPQELLPKLKLIIDHFDNRLKHFGKAILFEHGTTPKIGGGCGIYHAHIHMVPAPSTIPPEFILGPIFNSNLTLEEALRIGKKKQEYLLYRDIQKNFYIASMSRRLQSQYFRKKLHEFFNLQSTWDWRKFGYEEKLISTLKYFRNSNRNISTMALEKKEQIDSIFT